MFKSRSTRAGWLMAIFACLACTPSYAGICVDVTVQTQALVGSPAGPFYLDFQLNDGSGLGNANNTATLSEFNFGTGSPAGSPITSGGASGDLGSTISITDSQFLNEFTQSFVPGSTLSFELMLTNHVESGPQPDEFSFFILDSTFTPIPTLDPVTGRDAFIVIDIDSSNPVVQSYGSDPSIPPAGGGGPITIAAPEIVNCPEPGSLTLLVSGVSLLAVSQRLRKMRTKINGAFRFRRS